MADVYMAGMKSFYCDDFYWLVSLDGLALGLFLADRDALAFYADQCEKHPEEEVTLWRLNGGYLCTPPTEVRRGR